MKLQTVIPIEIDSYYRENAFVCKNPKSKNESKKTTSK